MSSPPPSPDFRPGYATCSQVTPYCPIQATIYGSFFNLGGNVFFAIVFGLALIAHVALGYRYKTWSFSTWVILGCIFELLGYISRSVMVSTPWSLALVSLQICGLLWGPTLMSAGISIICKKIIDYCGTRYSVLPPVLVPWVFIGTDIVTVILQGSGGIIASVAAGATGSSLGKIGEDIIIAGVCFQVAHMTFCGTLMIIYMWRYKKDQRRNLGAHTDSNKTGYENDKAKDPKVRQRLMYFFWALIVAYIGVLVRSIYRVPEMAGKSITLIRLISL